jgi:hypothetical protein
MVATESASWRACSSLTVDRHSLSSIASEPAMPRTTTAVTTPPTRPVVNASGVPSLSTTATPAATPTTAAVGTSTRHGAGDPGNTRSVTAYAGSTSHTQPIWIDMMARHAMAVANSTKPTTDQSGRATGSASRACPRLMYTAMNTARPASSTTAVITDPRKPSPASIDHVNIPSNAKPVNQRCLRRFPRSVTKAASGVSAADAEVVGLAMVSNSNQVWLSTCGIAGKR